MYESLKNWGRWGADDQRGALNHLTDARRAAAVGAGAHRASRSAWPTTWPPSRCPSTPTRSSTTCWPRATPATPTGSPATRRPATTSPSTCTACGPPTSTPSPTCSSAARCSAAGPASEVRSDGARSNTVLSMADGVVGRGVLLDVPRASGRDFLDAGEVVTVADLEATEEAQGVTVGAGDILLVAWGREARRAATGGSTASPGCTPSACRGCTSGRWPCSGATGSRIPCRSWARPDWPFPVHQIGITGHGPAPHRQHGAGRAWASAAPPPGAGSSCSPWRPLRIAEGHRLPGQPGGGAVTRRTTSCGRCCSATPAPPTIATSTALAALFHPGRRDRRGRGAARRSRSGSRPCARPRAFPTSMHVLGDPLIALDDGGGPRPRSTPTPSCTS